MKGIFSRNSCLAQLALLLGAVAIGFFFASVATVVATIAFGGGDDFSVAFLQAAQFASSVLVFLLPALFVAWICSEHPVKFLNIRSFPDVRTLALVVAATLLLSLAVSLTGWLNEQMRLPEFLAPIERMMREAEDASAAMVAKMLSQEGLLPLLVNIIVIAATAAVCEEFLFRGTLTSILMRKISSTHTVVWTVAIVFSAIHFQFYGFVPRMLLGALLGYLLVWTRNIWAPIVAHFVNNAVAVVGMSDKRLKDNAFFAEELPADDAGWFVAVAAVGLIAAVWCLRTVRNLHKPANA